MPTIQDLFKSRKSSLYANTDARVDVSINEATPSEIFIESRGLINIPRKAAQLTTGPSNLASLIGNAAGALLKGSAKRPSDTLFASKRPLAKPLSLLGPLSDFVIKDVSKSDPGIFVKRDPGPGAELGKIINGTSTPGNAVKNAAIQALSDPGKTIAAVNKLFKPRLNPLDGYGPLYLRNAGGIKNKNLITTRYSTHTPNAIVRGKMGEWSPPQLEERKHFLKGSVDEAIEKILANKIEDKPPKNATADYDFIRDEIEKYDVSYVLISPIDRPTFKILLPGTISGLSEDISPEISDYRYLGSPFKLYKYLGVERTIKFNLKLYFIDEETKKQMQRNLEKITSIAFPNPKISATSYEGSSENLQLSMAPNILQLTVTGFFENIYCIMDSLSYNIDDNVPWVNNTFNENNNIKQDIGSKKKVPAVIDVSFSFRIIENPTISKNDKNEYMWDYMNDKDGANKGYFHSSEKYTEKKSSENGNTNTTNKDLSYISQEEMKNRFEEGKKNLQNNATAGIEKLLGMQKQKNQTIKENIEYYSKWEGPKYNVTPVSQDDYFREEDLMK